MIGNRFSSHSLGIKSANKCYGPIDPGGRHHAYEHALSCRDDSGICAYHGLVNVTVAQGHRRQGDNPNAGFEQLNAALGRVEAA
jgi:hypothetical protein